MDRCPSCAAGVVAGAAWCGQCFAALAPAPAAAVTRLGAPPAPGRMFAPAPVPPPAVRRSRWAKSSTTYGPLGRLVATLAVFLPLCLMAVGGLADPFVWGGAVVWLVVVIPWALRDIWRVGVVPERSAP